MHSEIKAVCAVSAPTQITRADSLTGYLKEWKEKGYFEKWSSKYGNVKIPYDFVTDRYKWSALKVIKKIKVPILIILGKEDTVVSPENTRRLFAAAGQPKELIEIEGMNHDYKKFPEQMTKVNKLVNGFLTKNLAQTS